MATRTMFTDFDYFMDSINMEAIQKIISMPLEDDEKRTAIAYILSKPLEGISINFPKKAHSTTYARLLMARGIEVDVVSQSLEITIKTLNKYKGVK